MADSLGVTDENTSPSHEDLVPPPPPVDHRGTKRARGGDEEDEEEEKGGRERRKIEIKFIEDKSRRHITFSKRKAGIMKKAYELSVLTGTQVLLLVVSETGLVYTFTTPKLQPLVTKPEGKNLIQACLNAPEPAPNENGVDVPEVGGESPEDVAVAQSQSSMPLPGGLPYMTTEQKQQMAYYQNLQQQQQAQASTQYSGMPVGTRHQPTA